MATPTTLPASFVSGAVLEAAQLNNLRGAFRILQVVSTTKTDTFVSGTVTAGSEVDITGLTATITPSSTSSKILVMFNVYGNSYINSLQRAIFGARVYRGATLIGAGAAAGNRSRMSGQTGIVGVYDGFGIVSAVHLDEPATTSATTYKITAVYAPFDTTSANALYVNRTFPDTDAVQWPRTASFITLMEVSA